MSDKPEIFTLIGARCFVYGHKFDESGQCKENDCGVTNGG